MKVINRNSNCHHNLCTYDSKDEFDAHKVVAFTIVALLYCEVSKEQEMRRLGY